MEDQFLIIPRVHANVILGMQASEYDKPAEFYPPAILEHTKCSRWLINPERRLTLHMRRHGVPLSPLAQIHRLGRDISDYDTQYRVSQEEGYITTTLQPCMFSKVRKKCKFG